MELKKTFWKSINKPIVWVSLFAIAALIPLIAAPDGIQAALTLRIRAFIVVISFLLILREYVALLTLGHLNFTRILPKIVLCAYVIKFGPSILSELYVQGKNNPEIAAAVGLSCLGWVAINWISNKLDRILDSFQDLGWKNQKQSIDDLKTADKSWEPKLCTSKDISVTCIHEAGHTLVYAALPNIPEQFRMKALPQADGRGRLGSVSSVDWNGILKPRDFLLIQLLMLLAGQKAEECILGELFDGAHSDLRYWQEEAKNYLRLGFGEFYFSPVENDFEAEQNRQVLERLRDEQGDLLIRFFQANQEVLQDLAKELEAKGKLLKADVEPFLSKAQLVDGFPRVTRED
ncbi:hypothetical protein ACSYAD_23110 [Acaryochloris marina NIES-2412]|uniref:hypothetical protein n=1 Tax=Acaryochloris marina TaxID=155978 RepID=UPI00405A2332